PGSEWAHNGARVVPASPYSLSTPGPGPSSSPRAGAGDAPARGRPRVDIDGPSPQSVCHCREGSMATVTPNDRSITRRQLLKVGGGALAAAAMAPHLGPGPAVAQTSRRGGVLRLTFQVDPIGFDPHQTISFATMVPLSFVYSR